MKDIKNLIRARLWYKDNKDKPEFKIKQKSRLKSWREKYPERYLWQRAKARSQLKNIHFDLKPEDINIPAECPALKVPMVYGTRFAPSLDRIDPEKGYVKDNIQVISRKANLMKQDATAEELRNFAEWVNISLH